MLATRMTVALLVITVFILGPIWFLEVPRNKTVYLVLALKLSTDNWPILLLPFLGFVIFIFLWLLLNFGMKTSVPSLWPPTLFFTLKLVMLKLTISMSMKKLCTRNWKLVIYLLMIKLKTSSLKASLQIVSAPCCQASCPVLPCQLARV
ncbi:hypothetical protein L3X38_038276 [Prunus dulcis]|uniref:Uncharacterized protein n=1 Tax=Prunus dulcis TaxID=3755 RepID=A0AAD4V621_PRUDU|nr:hypothetical protein L3X38_038276 [Prunus dulcis]